MHRRSRSIPHNSSRWTVDPLGSEIRAELRRFGPQAGMAELVERWPAVVGDAIARNAWPARISRDGTVQVHTADSVWAFELGQRAAEMAERLGGPVGGDPAWGSPPGRCRLRTKRPFRRRSSPRRRTSNAPARSRRGSVTKTCVKV